MATQSMVSSGGSGTQPAQGSPQSTAVWRIIQVDLDDLDETMGEPVVRMLRMVNAYFMDYANDTMNVAVELEVTGGFKAAGG